MEREAPLLESLTHRLSECPAEFLADPSAQGPGTIDVAAIVCDHFRAMGLPPGDARRLALLQPATSAAMANRLRLVAVAIWLLHDDDLRTRPELGDVMWKLLTEDLNQLSSVVRAETIVSDPDRREELARFCLHQLGLRPRGESAAQAADRLTALDSVERDRVVRQMRESEARAREVRQMMARRAAEEAAAKVSRE
jgi:hypothetical protein